jgi:hypothetical protein
LVSMEKIGTRRINSWFESIAIRALLLRVVFYRCD